MALRVLLADESSTIKKVFQLALQDFAVEVRPVNVGVDVVPVAQSFKPDIIFADVLLQKKNGYEVSSELKQDPGLKGIPIVLMWSGFMELDEDKFQACAANAQLEKPFDVAALRKLVAELVPRTQGQRLSEFLTFPPMPEMEEKAAPPPAPKDEPDEDFQQMPVPKKKGGQEKFRVNLKPEEMEPQHIPVEYEVPSEKISMDDVFRGTPEEEPFKMRAPTPAAKVQDPELEVEEELVEETDEESFTREAATVRSAGGLNEEQLEKIIREQSREVIESVVWKIVPDLAAQIIERELNRLLKERESQPY